MPDLSVRFRPHVLGTTVTDVQVALIGATGRTGVLTLDELVLRRHEVRAMARTEGRIAPGSGVAIIVGDSRDRAALSALVTGVDAVVSTLGPRGREGTLMHDTAMGLVDAMTQAKVRRFVGVSGAALDAPGDEKSTRAKVVSRIVRFTGGAVGRDKREEYEVFAGSNLDWTLVRPFRLYDGDETGTVMHNPFQSVPSMKMCRADLATFLVDVLEQGLYIRQAPFVGTR